MEVGAIRWELETKSKQALLLTEVEEVMKREAADVVSFYRGQRVMSILQAVLLPVAFFPLARTLQLFVAFAAYWSESAWLEHSDNARG